VLGQQRQGRRSDAKLIIQHRRHQAQELVVEMSAQATGRDPEPAGASG
jgi:hypothetical protein